MSFSRLRFLPALAFLLPLSAFAASQITGVVTNGTTGKPAAGDDVVLIRLAQGMQESTRTKTDARGHFTLDVPDEGIHLIRVLHDKANYFRPAPPGTQSVEIEVYNAAAKVKGVSQEADVLRIQTDPSGSGLKIVENFFVKNDSAPPMTQFSTQPFDFYLPEGAVVEGSAALAPGGMPVQAAPVPLADKNHFTFLFPIRPGETRFQVSYHLPYTGKIDLAPRLAQKVGTVAIMLPKSITFTAAAGSPYSPVTEDMTAQTFVARDVAPSASLGFSLSGTGQLPRDSQNPDQGAQSAPNSAAPGGVQPETENTAPGRGLQNPLDPNSDRDPWGKYKWWILSGLLLVLVVAAAVLLRKPATAAVPLEPGDRALATLKDELFALESDHLQGRISEEDYQAHKAALETVLRRVLARNAADTPGQTPQ